MAGIQQAGTFDTDTVAAVFDDPNFRFDYFGSMQAKLGGCEYYSIARDFPFPIGLTKFQNGEAVQVDLTFMEIP
jgi:hypothetical protein